MDPSDLDLTRPGSRALPATGSDLGERERVVEFLRRFAGDPENIRAIREAISDHFPALPVLHWDDEQALRWLAQTTLQCRTRLRPVEERARIDIPEEAPEAKSKAAAPKTPEKIWIKVQVVEDATGDGVPNAALKITLPNGSQQQVKTNADGWFELRDIDSGVCELTSEYEGRELKDTWAFAGLGGSVSGKAMKAAGDVRIARIDECKVSKGETLESLAESVSLSAKDLAKFNWGTGDAKEIQKALRKEVGCTTKNDKDEWAFDDKDEPGIVYLPAKWREQGLDTLHTHVVRVKRIEQLLVDLTIPVEMDLDDDPDQDDELRLKAEDGSYEKELKEGGPDVERDEERRMLLFRFREVPPGFYSVSVKIAGEWCEILHDFRVCAQGLKAWGQPFHGDLTRVSLGNPEDPEPESASEDEEPAGEYRDHDHEVEE